MLSSINNKQNCQCVLTKDVRFLYYKKEVHSFKSNQSIWFDLKFIAYSFCTLDGSKGRDVVTTDGGFNTYNDKLLLIIMLQTILHNLDLNCHKSKKKKKKTCSVSARLPLIQCNKDVYWKLTIYSVNSSYKGFNSSFFGTSRRHIGVVFTYLSGPSSKGPVIVDFCRTDTKHAATEDRTDKIYTYYAANIFTNINVTHKRVKPTARLDLTSQR